MAKKKVCKNCGYLTDQDTCPICQNKQFVDKYKTLVLIVDPKNSEVAKKTGKKEKGLFAIKY